MTSLLLQTTQGTGGGMGGMILMLVAIFAIMYFFMIRPQSKRQKKIREFQNSLESGSKVITNGGIYGTVRHIDTEKNTIDLEVAKGVVITVDKGCVFADNAQRQPNA